AGQTITLDPTFGQGGKAEFDMALDFFDETATCIGVQSNGKIIFGGEIEPFYTLMRLLPNGDLDITFGDSGVVRVLSDAICHDLVILDDDRILSCGTGEGGVNFPMMSRAVVAMNLADGSPDTSFNGSGYLLVPSTFNVDAASGIALQSDGKILVTGYFGVDGDVYVEMVAIRLDQQGQLDPSFGGDGIVTKTLNAGGCWGEAIVQMPDGRIVFGGTTNYFLDKRVMICRVMPDGSNDPSFGNIDGIAMTSGPFEYYAFDMELQPDGKPVLGGYDAWGPLAAFRFNVSGSLDVTFGGDGVATGTFAIIDYGPAGLVALEDGSFIVAGQGEGPFQVNQFSSDGTLMATASTGFGEPAAAWNACIQSDGKLLVCGNWHSILNGEQLAIARYDLDSPTALDEGHQITPKFSIYPNPVFELLWVRSSTILAKSRMLFSLTDLSGRVIKELIPMEGNDTLGQTLSFSMKDICPGLYSLNIFDGSVLSCHLLVKQ
ncbi:MAG: hypothetical protein WAR83_10780, partial [Flavobacteriales bacterium]